MPSRTRPRGPADGVTVGASSPPPLAAHGRWLVGASCPPIGGPSRLRTPLVTAYSGDAGRPARVRRGGPGRDRHARTGHGPHDPFDAGGRPPAGIATAAGVSAGQALWPLATSIGLAALIVASEPVFLVIRVVGAAYLFWLGGRAIASAIRGERAASAGDGHDHGGVAGRRLSSGAAEQPLQPQDGRVLHEPAATVRTRWRVRHAARPRAGVQPPHAELADRLCVRGRAPG